MQKVSELTSLCPAIQSKCTNVVDIQNNHIYEQCDAYPQDHTSYLTVGKGVYVSNFSCTSKKMIGILITTGGYRC